MADALVYVPAIGFRPGGTLTLHAPAEKTRGDTRIRVVAAAAAPGRVDVLIEWRTNYDRDADCPPLAAALMSQSAPDRTFTARIVVDATILPATRIERRACSFGSAPAPPPRHMVQATQALTFPALPQTDRPVELRIGTGAEEWPVPLDLGAHEITAIPLAAESRRGDVIVGLSAVALRDREVVVEMLVTSPRRIRAIGAPLPEPALFIRDSEQTRQERRSEIRRVLGGAAAPIILETDSGETFEEIGRTVTPGWYETATREPAAYRCAVVFERPEAFKRGTLVVPYVDLMDLEPAVDVDLRAAPVDLAIGEHRFRLISAEPYGDERRLALEIPPSTASPRFIEPARVGAAGSSEFSFGGSARDGTRWMAVKVADPPVVTFRGVVLRVEGPWRLDFQAV